MSFSRMTMSRRFEDLTLNLKQQLKNQKSEMAYVSLPLDESTDITHTVQLLDFIGTVDENFIVRQELAELLPLHGQMTGAEMYKR